jgi:uncharacterized membrane protein YeaQ/YmgE (transglycosylase-associated protein family)
MGNIIWQLIVGLIVGVIARLILPGREALPAGALGWLITALIGVAGAFLGAFIATLIWAEKDTYVVGWIMSILGSILLLVVVRLIFGRGTTNTTT